MRELFRVVVGMRTDEDSSKAYVAMEIDFGRNAGTQYKVGK